MKNILFFTAAVLFAMFMSAACSTTPAEAPTPAPAPVAQPPKPETAPAPVPERKPAAANYQATKEEYDKTFVEVEGVIQEISAFIKAGNFAEWRHYLTPKYVDRLLEPENLAKMNEQPIIKKQNVSIRSLDDYFTYVVVPSRVNARLDEILFADASRVEALMKIGANRFLLYQLEKVGDTWKISVW